RVEGLERTERQEEGVHRACPRLTSHASRLTSHASRPTSHVSRHAPMTTRIEKDPLGEKAVPAGALYGIQSLRAVENFPISGLRPMPAFVDAMIWIKRSAALTHKETGRLEPALADAIVRAAD